MPCLQSQHCLSLLHTSYSMYRPSRSFYPVHQRTYHLMQTDLHPRKSVAVYSSPATEQTPKPCQLASINSASILRPNRIITTLSHRTGEEPYLYSSAPTPQSLIPTAEPRTRYTDDSARSGSTNNYIPLRQRDPESPLPLYILPILPTLCLVLSEYGDTCRRSMTGERGKG